jgi:hypothetical protein
VEPPELLAGRELALVDWLAVEHRYADVTWA